MIALVTALAYLLFFIALIVGFLAYVIVQTRKRKRLQAELATSAMSNPANASGAVFPVKYARGKSFKSWIKVFPWEASGVLQLVDGAAVFRGKMNNGRAVELAFAPQNTQTKWIGRTFINGATSWFMLEQNGEQHYFTAETGATVFGSKGGSQEILNHVSAHLARSHNGLHHAR